ncbi:zinc metalloproteinase nas-14-like [Malaya genurostris]|uniref:zinc metalloproteinase nas-14-like n=1 Tax=Malaya genurostris TaxID=325434 RepID=UPI0026F3F5D9|nr:zinc metalloproteinase nas-14-like [Malaya genurostris]
MFAYSFLVLFATLLGVGVAKDFFIPINYRHKPGEANFATRPFLEVGERLRYHDQKVNKTFAFEQGIGYYYQYDIMLKPEVQRNAIPLGSSTTVRWPDAVVPYVIIGTFTAAQLANIQTAMNQYAAKTCVRFKPRTTETIYVNIDSGNTGCWSYVGRSMDNTYNLVNLQAPGCLGTGTIAHELMHALGFYHEFTRPDRDDWVSIDTSALQPQYQTTSFYNANFAKFSASQVELYGIPYYYGSVMHYSKYAGAASASKPVMTNLKPWVGDFGNNVGLSDTDILAINYMYCNSSTTTTTTLAPTTTKVTTTTTKATTTTTKPTTTTTKPTTTTTKATTTTTRRTTTTTTRRTTTTTTQRPRGFRCLRYFNNICIISVTTN